VNIARNLQNNYLHYIIITLVIIMTCGLIASVSLKHTSGDFDVYYKASQNYLARAPLYNSNQGIEEFKYLPLFALVFSPLAMIKALPALYLWSILNIFLLYFIFFLLYRLKQFSLTLPKDLLLIICLFALTGRYILANIKLGQVNILLCFLMVLTMYFEINKRYFWAAVVLAFSLMIKFFPLLFLIYFVLRRRFRIVAYTILTIIIFLLLPSVYSGFGLNLRYLRDWFILLKSTPAHLLYSVKNYSLISFFSWFFIARHEPYAIFNYRYITKGLSPEVYSAWVVSCFVFFSAFFYDTFFVKDKDPKIAYLDYSCLFVCGLLFNPLAYLNALVFLIVPYFFILRSLFYAELKKKYILVAGSLILLSFILCIVYNKAFARDIQQFYLFLEYRPLLWTIILVYLSLWLVKFALKLKSAPIP
jgi:hypothetical protein